MSSMSVRSVSDTLADTLANISLADHSHLLFKPAGDKAWLRQTFANIPRYLFRVATPKSDGSSDDLWVKSKDACTDQRQTQDIFDQDDDHIASMLRRHLRWKGTPYDRDNFMSWTSSLLLALQYVFYRYNHYLDRSRLFDIRLYIIDTQKFASGAFLRDVDLIQVYKSFDDDLENLEQLRNRKHRSYSGYYYFGEYLSQGALNIENKCQITSAQALVDGGLFLLRPEFQDSMFDQEGGWAHEVIRLREQFYQPCVDRPLLTSCEGLAAKEIAQLFEPDWRLPIALYMISLLPRQESDPNILQLFRDPFFTDKSRRQCSSAQTGVGSFEFLPEVKQFRMLIACLHVDFYLCTLEEETRKAEDRLRQTEIRYNTISLLDFDKSVWTSPRLSALNQRLNSIKSTGDNLLQGFRSLEEKLKT